MFRRHYLIPALAALALAMAVPAFAGKGGNGNGKGGGNGDRTAWVTASPNPASAGGSRVWVQGCGYDVDHSVELRVVHSAGYTEAWGVGVWYTGCMNPTPLTTSEAGTYRIEVYQQNSPRLDLMATASLAVG